MFVRRALDDLGAVRFGRGDHEGAIRAYREYLERFADAARAPEIRCLLAYSLLQVGDGEGAVLAAERLLERLDPDRDPDQRRLQDETVKILAAVRSADVDDMAAVRREVTAGGSPWSLETLVAILAIHAAEGRADLALQGLDLLSERGLLGVDEAGVGVKSQLVSCCLALRTARPESDVIHRWLLRAAAALDSLERSGEAGEILQWLRTHASDPSVRREAREQQLRGVD